MDALSDRELLTRFRRGGDEQALTALVRRHAPMVLGVCRRIAPRSSADDAFQAAFLVLLEKCGSIREVDFGPWLYRVAVRVCLEARREQARQSPWPADAAEPVAECEAFREIEVRETQTIVEEEIGRLPERLRSPLVLFHMQGKSRGEIARVLDCSAAAVKSRLERARRRLRERLVRRGIALSSVLAALALAGRSAAAGAKLLQCTQRLACLWRSGGTIETSVLRLSNSVLREFRHAMLKSNLKVVCVSGVAAVVALLVGLNLHHLSAAPPAGSGGGARLSLAPARAAEPAGDAPVEIEVQRVAAQAPIADGKTAPAATQSAAGASGPALPTGKWIRKVGPYEMGVSFEGNLVRAEVLIEGLRIEFDGECSITRDGIVYGVIHGADIDLRQVGDDEFEDVLQTAALLTDQPFCFRVRQTEDRLYVKDLKCGYPGAEDASGAIFTLAVGTYHVDNGEVR